MIAGIRALVRLEAHFFLHYPRLLLAAIVVVLIPALYVVIYLASVWDPAAKTGALAVGVVNLDQGLVYRDQAFSVGHDVISRLQTKPTFGYVNYASEMEVRHLVQTGALGAAAQLGQRAQTAAHKPGALLSFVGRESQALSNRVASRATAWIFLMALVRVLNLTRSIPAP